jgi:hypothetical protein
MFHKAHSMRIIEGGHSHCHANTHSWDASQLSDRRQVLRLTIQPLLDTSHLAKLSRLTVKWNSCRLAQVNNERHRDPNFGAPAARVFCFRANPGTPRRSALGVVPSSHAQPRLRSWPLGRRSGCSPAVPYPPPRSTSVVARPSSSCNLSRTRSRQSPTFTRLLVEMSAYPPPRPSFIVVPPNGPSNDLPAIRRRTDSTRARLSAFPSPHRACDPARRRSPARDRPVCPQS